MNMRFTCKIGINSYSQKCCIFTFYYFFMINFNVDIMSLFMFIWETIYSKQTYTTEYNLQLWTLIHVNVLDFSAYLKSSICICICMFVYYYTLHCVILHVCMAGDWVYIWSQCGQIIYQTVLYYVYQISWYRWHNIECFPL